MWPVIIIFYCLVLNKPVNLKYRNVSIDDFLADMPAVKKVKCHPEMILTGSFMSRTRCSGCRNCGQWVIKNEND